MAKRTFPLRISTSPSARRSPIPTQLKGRRIVKGSWYWSNAARAKYSTASFWNPYDDKGGGTSRSCPSYEGHVSVDSKTIDELRYVTFCRRPSVNALIAASQEEAIIRSFVAKRSYA